MPTFFPQTQGIGCKKIGVSLRQIVGPDFIKDKTRSQKASGSQALSHHVSLSLVSPFLTSYFSLMSLLLTCFYCLNMLVTKHDHLKASEFYVLSSRGQLRLSRIIIQICGCQISNSWTWVRGPTLMQSTLAKPMLIGGEIDSQRRGFRNRKTF